MNCEICQNCAFWKQRWSDEVKAEKIEADEWVGICARYPSVFVGEGEDATDWRAWGQPVMMFDDSCGEFLEKRAFPPLNTP